MERKDYNRSMGKLQVVYGKTMQREQAESWFEYLEQHEAPALEKAVEEIVQTKKIFPSLAELLDVTMSFETVRRSELSDYKAPLAPETAKKFLALLKGKLA